MGKDASGWDDDDLGYDGGSDDLGALHFVTPSDPNREPALEADVAELGAHIPTWAPDLGDPHFSAPSESNREPTREADVAELGAHIPTRTLDTSASPDPNPREDSDGADSVTSTTVTVSNPPRTVAVSVFADGSFHEVALSPKASGMRESELADEIRVVAGLAWQKALAAQHGAMSEYLRQSGIDEDVIADLTENGMELPSPEEAEAARAEAFAARYATEHRSTDDVDEWRPSG